jgi:SAM-dependent methyltransferase
VLDRLRRTVRPLTNIGRAVVDTFYAPALFLLAGRKAEGIIGTRSATAGTVPANPLESYFDAHKGAGLWKWRHYFDAYHAHFSRFQGRKPRILEIGVYSGGSSEMWREYFGEGCEYFGVDIDPQCLRFNKNGVTIKTANQSDRAFWRRFREEVGEVDIVIDDGGHRPRQQRPTFEEILRCIKPGGVYLCEDIHGLKNPFAAYMRGIANELNANRFNGVQAWVRSVTFYPYIAVLEILDRPRAPLVSERRGDDWLEPGW